MKKILILCLMLIWWHATCSSGKPTGFRVNHIKRGDPAVIAEVLEDSKKASEIKSPLNSLKASSGDEKLILKPEHLDGPKTAGVTEPTRATPAINKEPEKVSVGDKKPWHQRLWQRVKNWFHTSNAPAARFARGVSRWFRTNKAKPKTAEEVKAEKEAQELQKQVDPTKKAQEAHLSSDIGKSTKVTAKDNQAIAKDSNKMTPKPNQVAQDNAVAKQDERAQKEGMARVAQRFEAPSTKSPGTKPVAEDEKLSAISKKDNNVKSDSSPKAQKEGTPRTSTISTANSGKANAVPKDNSIGKDVHNNVKNSDGMAQNDKTINSKEKLPTSSKEKMYYVDSKKLSEAMDAIGKTQKERANGNGISGESHQDSWHRLPTANAVAQDKTVPVDNGISKNSNTNTKEPVRITQDSKKTSSQDAVPKFTLEGSKQHETKGVDKYSNKPLVMKNPYFAVVEELENAMKTQGKGKAIKTTDSGEGAGSHRVPMGSQEGLSPAFEGSTSAPENRHGFNSVRKDDAVSKNGKFLLPESESSTSAPSKSHQKDPVEKDHVITKDLRVTKPNNNEAVIKPQQIKESEKSLEQSVKEALDRFYGWKKGGSKQIPRESDDNWVMINEKHPQDPSLPRDNNLNKQMNSKGKLTAPPQEDKASTSSPEKMHQGNGVPEEDEIYHDARQDFENSINPQGDNEIENNSQNIKGKKNGFFGGFWPFRSTRQTSSVPRT